MLDFFHLPQGNADVKFFQAAQDASASLQWMTWQKPRGVSMIGAIVIGGGGGGGGGFSASAAAARGGGGSGGSSAIARFFVPAFLMPDILHVAVGAGGPGGAAGATGTAGQLSNIAAYPNLLSCVVQSGSAAPTGGNGGTGSAGGAAGAAGTAAPTNNIFALTGSFSNQVGHAGVAGGAQTGAIGTPNTFPTLGIPTMGGAGGAGTTSADFAGGIITAVAGAWLSEQRPAGAAAGSNPGSSGFVIWRPFFSFGGLGGSSSNTGVGGRGGDGGLGSGGGGGGGGTTGGRGGDGGPGLVVIYCW